MREHRTKMIHVPYQRSALKLRPGRPQTDDWGWRGGGDPNWAWLTGTKGMVRPPSAKRIRPRDGFVLHSMRTQRGSGKRNALGVKRDAERLAGQLGNRNGESFSGKTVKRWVGGRFANSGSN